MDAKFATITKLVIDKLSKADVDFEVCANYGGRDNDSSVGAVLVGDWWKRVQKLNYTMDEHGDTVELVPTTELIHLYETLIPKRVRTWLEYGYSRENLKLEVDWQDEYAINYDGHGQGILAWRSQPDHYGWQSEFIYTDGGEMLTIDDDVLDWVEWALVEPAKRPIFTALLPKLVSELGYEKVAPLSSSNDRYESGWHEGMCDDPSAIIAAGNPTTGKPYTSQAVIAIGEVSQFYTTWEVWDRPNYIDDNN